MGWRRRLEVSASGRVLSKLRARISHFVRQWPHVGLATCWLALAALFATTWALATTTTTYDPNGRLVLETNASGQTARYVYDKLGNLIKVERLSANDLAITSFSPSRGAPGVVVKVRGHGFSPTPAQNTLKFNGATATITSATATELTTSVPAIATSGPITVTVASQSASSLSNFVVDPNAHPPVITSVAPLIAAIGTSITADGQALEPFEGQSRVALGPQGALASSVTNTQLVFPAGTSSGRVSITTAYGTGVSTNDVLILPADVALADIEQVRRLEVGGPALNVALTTAGKQAALLFDAQAGQLLSLQFTGIAANMSYKFYRRADQLIEQSYYLEPSNASVHLPTILEAGTYLVLVSPSSAPSNWSVSLEEASQLIDGGAPYVLAAGPPGQSKRFKFHMTSGGNYELGFSEIATSTGGSGNLFVYQPSGTQPSMVSCTPAYEACQVPFNAVQNGGLYNVVVRPPATGTMTISGKLSFSSNLIAQVQSGTPTSVAISRRGQNATVNFSGNQGDALAVQFSVLSTTPNGKLTSYSVVGPAGGYPIATGVLNAGANTVFNLPNLPTTGTYRLFIDPQYAAAASLQVGLLEPVSGTLTTDGAMPRLTTQAQGQPITLSFTASAGQNLGMGLTTYSTPGASAKATAYVLKSDGTQLMYQDCFTSYAGCDLDLRNLQAGNYRVVLAPAATSTTPLDVSASLSADVAAVLTTGTPHSITLGRPGQDATLQFSGTQGQWLNLLAANVATTPTSRQIAYEIRRPNGSVLWSGSISSQSTADELPSLPETGTYTLWLDPAAAATASLTMTIVAAQEGSLTIDGAGVTFSNTQKGEQLVINVSVPQAMRVDIGMIDVVSPEFGGIDMIVYGPDGQYVYTDDNSCSPAACDFEFEAESPGVHQIVVIARPYSSPPDPGYQGLMAFKMFASSEVTANATAEVPLQVSVTRPGQRARVYYGASIGQGLSVRVDSIVTNAAPATWVRYGLYEADLLGVVSTDDGAASMDDGGITLNELVVDQTQPYVLTVNPDLAATASMNVTVLLATTGTIAIDGLPVTVSTTERSRMVKLSFNAPAAAYLGVGVQDLVMPESQGQDSNRMLVALDRPPGNGYDNEGVSCTADYSGTPVGMCDLDVWNMAQGPWELILVPNASGEGTTMSLTATLSLDKVQHLLLNQSTPLVLDRRGQNAILTFDGTSGQNLALVTESLTQDPVASSAFYNTVDFEVRRSNGGLVNYGKLSLSTPTVNISTLPANDLYRIYVDPSEGRKISTTVRLTTR